MSSAGPDNVPTGQGPAPRPALAELALLFLRLGATAFGGPAAHVALMEDEVVRRRAWLTRDEFLDLLGATNLIPGPNSTELAIHVGHRRAGWRGLLVAGTCFIAPAVVVVLALAWAYVRFRALPALDAVLYGVKPVIIAVILQALWSLGRRAVKGPLLAAVGGAAVAATAANLHELLVLAAAGVVVFAARRMPGGARLGTALVPLGAAAAPLAAGTAAGAAPFGLVTLFLTLLKTGSVLFGSGYVLLAFLRADFVERLGWLTESQLLDAIAVGQFTPGPVFTTATFVGYLLAGVPGAAVATLGIFLPAFVFVAASGPLVPRLRRSAAAGALLDGVNVASLALMTVVTWQLGRSSLIDLPTVLLGAGAAVLLVRFRVNSAWLVLGGAAAGLALG